MNADIWMARCGELQQPVPMVLSALPATGTHSSKPRVKGAKAGSVALLWETQHDSQEKHLLCAWSKQAPACKRLGTLCWETTGKVRAHAAGAHTTMNFWRLLVGWRYRKQNSSSSSSNKSWSQHLGAAELKCSCVNKLPGQEASEVHWGVKFDPKCTEEVRGA